MDTPARMALEVRDDMRRHYQQRFFDRLLYLLVDHARLSEPGELPRQRVIFTDGCAEEVAGLFHREADVLASFLPEHFFPVDRRYMEKVMDTLAGAVLLEKGSLGQMLGPMDGKMFVDSIIHYSVGELHCSCENARQDYWEAQNARRI